MSGRDPDEDFELEDDGGEEATADTLDWAQGDDSLTITMPTRPWGLDEILGSIVLGVIGLGLAVAIYFVFTSSAVDDDYRVPLAICVGAILAAAAWGGWKKVSAYLAFRRQLDSAHEVLASARQYTLTEVIAARMCVDRAASDRMGNFGHQSIEEVERLTGQRVPRFLRATTARPISVAWLSQSRGKVGLPYMRVGMVRLWLSAGIMLVLIGAGAAVFYGLLAALLPPTSTLSTSLAKIAIWLAVPAPLLLFSALPHIWSSVRIDGDQLIVRDWIFRRKRHDLKDVRWLATRATVFSSYFRGKVGGSEQELLSHAKPVLWMIAPNQRPIGVVVK